MAMRFVTPPNWPAPPEGFVPPAGWQPDPAWGPAPAGWQFWVDDAQPVADPTGSQVSAASAPSVPEVPPVTTSAPSANPYAANSGQYAQAPTPYAGNNGVPAAAPGVVPVAGSAASMGGAVPVGNWQPTDVSSTQTKKRPWWFWLLVIVLPILLVIGLLTGIGALLASNGSNSSTNTTSNTSSDDNGGSTQSGGTGSSATDPADPTTQSLSMSAPDDADYMAGSTIVVSLGDVNWDASEIESDVSYIDDDETVVRVPVTVKYAEEGIDAYEIAPFDLSVEYLAEDGTIYYQDFLERSDEFSYQDWVGEGETISGYITFVLPEDLQQTGVWKIVAFNEDDSPMYMKAL